MISLGATVSDIVIENAIYVLALCLLLYICLVENSSDLDSGCEHGLSDCSAAMHT